MSSFTDHPFGALLLTFCERQRACKAATTRKIILVKIHRVLTMTFLLTPLPTLMAKCPCLRKYRRTCWTQRTQSYQLYGHAVDMILSSYIPEIGFNAASYLGGSNNSYLHKYEDQNDQKRKASEPIPAATQRLALDIVLRLLRPKDQGLLPPDEANAFLVESCSGALCSFDVDDIIRRLRTMLLQEILGHDRLVKLHRQEASSSSAEAFTLSELLSSVVRSVFAAGLDGPISDDERDLQRRFVFIFTSRLVADGSEHAAIMSQLQHYRDFTRQMVETALERLNTSMADNSASGIPSWNYCADYNQTCECDGLVRLQWPSNVSHEQWGAPVCLPENFDLILDEKTLKKSVRMHAFESD